MTKLRPSAFQGPAWDNTSEYAALDAKEIAQDFDRAQALTAELLQVTSKLKPLVAKAERLEAREIESAVAWAQSAARLFEDAYVLLWNLDTYASCELSVDGRSSEAKGLAAKVRAASSKLAQAYNPVEQFLTLTSEQVVERYLASPRTAPERYHVQRQRLLRDHKLSLAEEELILALSVDGPTAWGTLYDNLSGSIVCTLDVAPPGDKERRTVGLAEAASLSQDSREEVRRAAFKAVQKGWETHEESVAAILNSLSGWRLELYKRRSHKKPLGFLDEPLHKGGLGRATLDAMMDAVVEVREKARHALRLQARLLGKERLAPWDLFAPCPVQGEAGEQTSYDDAVRLISDAFSTVHPDMGAFVRMMSERRWIEGRVGPTKRPGAYCTKFPKSRTPRVYMTYTGGMRELKTLAHELGHAFHNWVMRDQPLPELFYPMTLAETASIFAETVVAEALDAQARDPVARLQVAWGKAREVESFCLNIPTRYRFEKAFYERRQAGPLTPQDLKQLMTESWADWYGDALSEMDPMFWASKLHFSIVGLTFYNFPYTFGYLFALGVYGQRERLGDQFFSRYVDLLRDTGRMTVEEVAAKHLGVDLTKPEFWRSSLKIAVRDVDRLEDAVAAVTRR